MIKLLFRGLFRLLVNSPFYPHWLDFKNRKRGNLYTSKYLYGLVLETGAGNCEKKELILKNNKKIRKYVVTDYSSWDDHFDKYNKKGSKISFLSDLIFGKKKIQENLDLVCNAMKLPFKDSSFDSYCSFEVLEHINDPSKFLSEAYRVLKKDGVCVVTLPYLYREHGGINFDFQRLSRGGIQYLCKKAGFQDTKIITFSYFGTTLSTLINQYIIRKILESSSIFKFLLLFIAPIIFFLTNIIGYIIDKLDHDYRFATAYHIVLRK